MQAVLTRTGDVPATTARETEPRRATRPALSEMVHELAERLVYSERDLPEEWFHYPIP